MIKNFLHRILLSEKTILGVILINTVTVFMMESGVQNFLIGLLDIACTLFFFAEMIFKNIHFGIKKYWTNPLDIMDGFLVIISLPTVIEYLFSVEIGDLSFLLVLRVLRILRMFRLTHVFPDFDIIVRNFKLAIRKSYAFFLIIFIFIIIFALIDCNLFRTAAPQYFETPMDAIYSTFRMFTVEGWYDIPDAVASGMQNEIWLHIVRFFFCAQLFLGGIIGMSLINSIFVDAMVSDNNDDLRQDIRDLKETLRQIQETLDKQSK